MKSKNCLVCNRLLPVVMKYNTHYNCLKKCIDFYEKCYGNDKDNINYNYWEFIEIYVEHQELMKLLKK